MAYICLFELNKDGSATKPVTTYDHQIFLIDEDKVMDKPYKLLHMKRTATRWAGIGKVVAKRVSLNIIGDYGS